MVYTHDNYAFWGLEASWKHGTGASVDQPFNPLETMGVPKPVYRQAEIRTFDSLEPKIVYTERMEIGESDLESTYVDPFLMLSMFTHKTVTGSWGAGATGMIVGDFTDDDDEDTIWMYYHKEDKSGSASHIDRVLEGGQISSYSWFGDEGGLLKEKASVKMADLDKNPTVRTMSTDGDFDDGAWADWDFNTHLSEMELKWNSNLITDVAPKSFALLIECEKHQEHEASSKVAGLKWKGIRGFSCTFTGKMRSTGIEFGEVESDYNAKTLGELRIYKDPTVGEEKYLGFEEAYIDSFDSYDIPAAGEAIEVTMTVKGGEDTRAWFYGTYVGLPDPSSRIST